MKKNRVLILITSIILVLLIFVLLFLYLLNNKKNNKYDFINDNIKLRNKKIVIIHGIGYGILRDEINRRFKRDKRVKKLYLSIDNAGCTIIELY